MPKYHVNWHHQVIAEYLDRFVAGEIKRLMIFAPPQFGKSELVSRRLPAYLLGRNPDAQIIACSYAFTLATRLNRDVQRIMDAREYRRLFPGTQLSGTNVRTKSQGTWLRNADIFEVVGRHGTYRSTGVGGGITGSGCNFGIIDDPYKDDEEAYSPTIRQKREDWYRGTFYTRLREGASIVVIATRWHRRDLMGTLLAEAEGKNADKWTVVSFPAMSDDEPSEYDPRKPGEVLWPAFKTKRDLDTIRTTLGPVKWSAMYQQEPRAEGGSEWPESMFGSEIWFDQWPREWIAKAIALDPSKGQGSKWGDYSAFALVMLGKDGLLYVDADMANNRNCSIIVQTALEWQRTFGADYFGVESNQFQELLADDMVEACTRAGMPMLPIYKITNTISKQVRIRRLTPWLSQGKIRFKGGSPGAKLLVEQLRDFPNAGHDDGPDALEMAIRLLAGLVGQGEGPPEPDNIFGSLGYERESVFA